MLTKHKSLKDFLIALLICILFFAFLFILYDFVFGINDDRSISNLIGGKFASPSQYGIFISILISYPLSKLYSWFPNIPFYGLMYIFLMFCVAIFVVFYVLNKINKKTIFKVSIIILILGLLLPSIVMPQFTILSALLIIPLIIIVLNFKNFSKNEKILYSILFFLFSFFAISVREDVFYMSIPFILLCIFINIQKEKKWIIVPTIFISITMLIVGTHLVSNNALLNNPEYKNYVEYNIVRSDLYDFYNFPDYEEHIELYEELGISEEAYYMLTNYIFDIPEASYENLCAIRDYQRSNYFSSISFFSVNKEISKSFFETSNLILIIAICPLFLYLMITSFKSNKRIFLLVLFTILGTIAIAVGLSIFMKFPTRIATSLLFFNLAILICLFNNLNSQPIKLKSKPLSILATVIVSAIALKNITTTKINNINSVEHCNDRIVIENYISNDTENLYMVDINITIPQSAFLMQPITSVYNLYYSDWFCFSPTYNDLMERLGYKSFADILENSDNFKFITIEGSNKFEYMKNYVEAKFNRTFVYESSLNDQFDIYSLVDRY